MTRKKSIVLNYKKAQNLLNHDRVKILNKLSDEEFDSTSELAEEVGRDESEVSKDVKKLYENGIVDSKDEAPVFEFERIKVRPYIMEFQSDSEIDKDKMQEYVQLSGEELNFLDSVLNKVHDESILPVFTASAQYTPLIDIMDKVSNAKQEISDRYTEIREDRSCEEDGHVWGDAHYEPETGFGEIVLRGCKYCSACQFKVIGEDSKWREVEEYRDLGVEK